MIWHHLGFKRDIFFVEPLRPNPDDIKLFVGREHEIKKYLIDTLSGQRSLKVVTGEVGVGKTTFVNACQYYSYIDQRLPGFEFALPKVLPCFEKIQVRETDDLNAFFQQTITAVCQSIAHHCRLQGINPPNEVKEILAVFLDLMIKTGGEGTSGGASVLGFGADFGRTAETKAQNVFRNARSHLCKLVEIAQREFGFGGVFVLVNNLDILSKEKLISFFNTARDEVFDIPGIYWTVIGRKGLGSVIETEVSRVADYLSGTELYVAPLAFSQTKLIVDLRVETFRMKPAIPCPLIDQSIEVIHQFSMQEIRETLKTCGEVVKSVISVDPSRVVIPHQIAMGAFVQFAHDRAKDLDLTESAVKVLKAVYEKRSCRPKDFALFGYKTTQAFSSALKGLVKKRLLSVEERGIATIYKMTGMTLFAAITGALGDDIQDFALDKLKGGQVMPIREDRFAQAQLELVLDN